MAESMGVGMLGAGVEWSGVCVDNVELRYDRMREWMQVRRKIRRVLENGHVEGVNNERTKK